MSTGDVPLSPPGEVVAQQGPLALGSMHPLPLSGGEVFVVTAASPPGSGEPVISVHRSETAAWQRLEEHARRFSTVVMRPSFSASGLLGYVSASYGHTLAAALHRVTIEP